VNQQIHNGKIYFITYIITHVFRLLITFVNKGFVPLGKMSVSGVFLDAEFKYFSRIPLLPTTFAPS
jgi:hypothetical protein